MVMESIDLTHHSLLHSSSSIAGTIQPWSNLLQFHQGMSPCCSHFEKKKQTTQHNTTQHIQFSLTPLFLSLLSLSLGIAVGGQR
jgi:hypothetical protein